MIDTIAAHQTDTYPVGPHAPKATATTEGVTEAAVDVWNADRIDTGIWECTPGEFLATREGYTEICVILSGRVTLQAEGGEPIEFGPGDVLVTPSGWKGVWRVHELVRKHYTIIRD
ncbi:cupin domain-containing protein [Leucobacter sp. W1478]|uniref:cupin domain-containing protein n=1 Tax=Leucobacter sp. W1478 TaxID=3439065 RepID=UPI003F2E334B